MLLSTLLTYVLIILQKAHAIQHKKSFSAHGSQAGIALL